RNAMDSGQPAHKECCSISSLLTPTSFHPRPSFPQVALVTRSWYSGGIISKNSGQIWIRSLLMVAPLVYRRHLKIQILRQLPRPAKVATDLPRDRWICSTITSGGIV